MAEQEQTVSTEQPTSTEAPATENTLDKVYEQFNVDAEAQTFQPQQAPAQPYVQAPAQTQAHPMPAIPDPVLDPGGFKTWQAAQSQEVLRELAGLKRHVMQQRVAEINRRDAEEVKTLVSELNKVVGLPEEDADVIEFALAKQVRSDPKFAALYQQRHQKPAAWKAATKAVAENLQKKYAVRTDPQLAENQRALKTAQQTTATTKQQSSNPLEEKLAGLTGAAWEREYNSWLRGGQM